LNFKWLLIISLAGLIILSCKDQNLAGDANSSLSDVAETSTQEFPDSNLEDSNNPDSENSENSENSSERDISALNEISNETAWSLFGFRGLTPPEEPIIVQEVSQEFLGRILNEYISTSGMDTVYEEDERLYKFLGFLEPEDKLKNIYIDVMTEQIPGLYSLKTGIIHIVADHKQISISDALLLAFVQGLAIQENHFQIANQHFSYLMNRDALLAIDSLSIGDSLLSIGFYGSNRFPEANIDELQINKSGDVFENSPTIVQQLFLFPFTFGIEFVHSLRLLGGWGEVNGAYTDLPKSSTEIIHPQKYIEGFNPEVISINNFSRRLPDNWEFIQDGVWGEFLLLLWLGSNLDGENAAKASTGWLGDRYVLIQNENSGDQAIAFATQWESNSEADEFVQLLSDSFKNSDFDMSTSTGKGVLNQPINRFFEIKRNKARVLLIVSTDEDSAELLMQKFDQVMN